MPGGINYHRYKALVKASSLYSAHLLPDEKEDLSRLYDFVAKNKLDNHREKFLFTFACIDIIITLHRPAENFNMFCRKNNIPVTPRTSAYNGIMREKRLLLPNLPCSYTKSQWTIQDTLRTLFNRLPITKYHPTCEQMENIATSAKKYVDFDPSQRLIAASCLIVREIPQALPDLSKYTGYTEVGIKESLIGR